MAALIRGRGRGAGERRSVADDEEELEPRQSIYQCRFCDLTFNKSQALGGHMNRHRQEREKENFQHAQDLLNSVAAQKHQNWPQYPTHMDSPNFMMGIYPPPIDFNMNDLMNMQGGRDIFYRPESPPAPKSPQPKSYGVGLHHQHLHQHLHQYPHHRPQVQNHHPQLPLQAEVDHMSAFLTAPQGSASSSKLTTLAADDSAPTPNFSLVQRMLDSNFLADHVPPSPKEDTNEYYG